MKLQKETEASEATHGRWYRDACGTAFALELVGERWSLLIVRELMLGGRRFSDLRRVLPGISAKVLTERLGGLEAAGVLKKRQIAEPVPAQIYELTEWGYYAEPAIQELGRWAARSPLHDPTLPLTPVGLMLSMRTLMDKTKAKAFDATIGFEVAGETFIAELKDGQLPIRRSSSLDDSSGAQLILRAPVGPVIAAMLYGKMPIETVEAEMGLKVEGDRELAAKYIGLFALPERVG